MYKANYATSPLATAAANSRVLLEGFHTAFMEEMKRAKPMYEEIFDVKKSDKLSEVYASWAGLGLAVLASDGGPTEFEDLSNGEVKEIRNYEYRKGYRITQATLEDDLYGITDRPMRSLPKSMEAKVESTAAALVGLSFTTTYGWDPQATNIPLIGNSHNWITGKFNLVTNSTADWSNVLSVAGPPTPENIADLYILSEKATDREGYPIEFGKKFILTAPDEYPTAWASMNSSNQAFELSNTRAITGPGSPWNMQTKQWKWLPAGDPWFMVDPENSPFIHQWRIKPYVDKDEDKNNFIQRVFARMRYGQGALEPRGIWGTLGS